MGKQTGCGLTRTLIDPLLVGDYPAQGIPVPDHGESIVEPGNGIGGPVTAAPFIKGRVYNSLECEAVLGEAADPKGSGNLRHRAL